MHEDKRLPLAVLCAVAAVFATAAVPALAKGPHGSTTGNSLNAGTHLTICHATPPDTAANGYVRISPSVSGVYHGHLRQHDADIIPPFVYADTTYSQNWDATGQAIWNNGCVAPASTSGPAAHGKRSGHKGSGKSNGKGSGGSHANSANVQAHVTICHATPPDTAANGYVRISPSVSGVYHGHLRQHDADIIPPFVYAGTTYSQNWDATGQAIWSNGCVTPSSSTSTSGSSTSGSSGTNGSSGSSGTSGSSSTSGSGTSPASSTSTHGVAGASKTIKHRARPAKPVTRGATFTG